MAIVLLTALLTPVFLFRDTPSATAAINVSLLPVKPPLALLSNPPPAPSNILSSTPLPTAALSSLTSLNSFLASGYASVVDFFSPPQLPAGFEMAKPVSPFAGFVSSISLSIAAFFGFGSSAAAKKTANNSASLNMTLAQPTGSVSFDFDGDGKADLARWRSASGDWQIKNSQNGVTSTFALGSGAGNRIAPTDYDGDGRTDAATFTAATGTWTIKRSSDSVTQTVSGFGLSGDIPAAGDYDGDGAADAAVWRPSDGNWIIKQSSNGVVISTPFGQAGDIPVAGNYDGDARLDYAIFRPSNGYWYVLGSSSGFASFLWGAGTDTPVPADYDGDGKTDYAVYRPSNGAWYAYKSGTNDGSYLAQAWGNYGDQPVPADYDGDGKAEYAVWRPTTGVWHIANSSNNTYSYQSLGTAGDIAVPSAYLKQISGPVLPSELAKRRLAPKNATGGTNLYSRNFSWGTGLVALAGRAGMDMGFGMSYNSLIWTELSNTMVFDTDNSNISPGFRFGFPTIEPTYYDSQTGKFAYLMVMPSGARVEFKQTTASNVYETVDSSYLQLKVNTPPGPNQTETAAEDLTLTMTGTDGTQLNYVWKGGAYRCNQIKDTNGNYITVNHDENGLLQSVTDTLGRVVTVNYDAQLYPTSITQTWKTGNGEGSNMTHTYATFTYTAITINTDFGSRGVYGPPNGTVIKVLNKVTFADNSSTRFEYNSYGQVFKISNYAADGQNLLNYVKTDLETPAGQTDCPRFTETRSYVQNFNGGGEVVVHNSFEENVVFSGGGGAVGLATLAQVWMDNAPRNPVSKTWFYAPGNWAEGLPFGTEDYADGTRQRWTRTAWTQDDPTLAYSLNPRVTESKVGDASNTKRTTIDYLMQTGTNAALYGLVSEVKVYDADQSTVLKRATTSYNLDTSYLSRRIIGLPSQSELYDGSNNLMAKVTYNYDEGDFTNPNLQQTITPVQHDNTNFGAGFIIGRGNLTSTTRYDVLYQSAAVTSSVKYNTAGAAVSSTDPMGREVKVSYADSFNDGINNRSTFAYPTTLTDAAGNFSQVKYRYDIGANVWAKSPAPAGNSNGKETTRTFDSLGRLERQTLVNNGAYTRYEYPVSQTQSKVYSTITAGAGEVLAESYRDGAGRVRQSRTEHPNSAGGWSGSLVEYDILGRVTRSSVPTEIDNNWQLAGDDATRGFLWTTNEYDWKGRVTRTINTDGTDRLISYDGCGCAGGQVTTIQSELVPRDDQPTVNARRTQKVYADILGRTYKTEVMNWDAVTPYTTTVNTFNGRDQVTQTRQYAGAEGSQTFQDVVMSYDGHGRLKTRHYPIEDAGANTTWIYNADDSIQQTIDPRGAITNFTYNDARGLLTNISYSVPNGSTIPVTPNVNLTYDNLGNRTQMSDGTGITAYAYNELSQMTSETKTFAGLAGNFTIGYTYQLAGKLKSISDPFGAVVNYNDDKAGRTTSVTGAGFLDVTTYAQNIKYRAFGGVKEMDYGSGDNSRISYGFDNRLRVSSYESTSTVQTGGYVRRATYEYFDDGKIKKVNNLVDAGFDQSYKFDQMGRLTANEFGMKTNNQNEQVRTYSQTIQYDAFDEMTSRLTDVWGEGDGFTANYINGRKQNSNEIYDAAGNIVEKPTSSTVYDRYKFDAAGRLTESVQRYYQGRPQQTSFDRTQTITQGYDGDGRSVKRIDNLNSRQVYPANTYITETSEYFVRSSVLGKVLTELDAQGAKKLTNVYTGDAVLAEQRNFPASEGGSAWSEVFWKHEDIITGSYQKVARNGGEIGMYNPPSSTEFEALGGIVPQSDPTFNDDELGGSLTPLDYKFGGNVEQPEFGCEMDNLPIPCNLLRDALRFYNGYEVGVRTQGVEGDWGAYYSLRNSISVRRYDIYREGDWRIDKSSGVADPTGAVLTRLASMYVFLISPFWEMAISQTQQQRKVNEKYIVYMPNEGSIVKKIKDIVDYAVNGKTSKECTKAFEAVGATPIGDQTIDVTIVTESVFNEEKWDSFWTAGSKVGEGMRNTLKEHKTTNDVSYPGLYGDTGRRFLGLTNRAITEEDDHLSVSLIHSFVHTGGKTGKDISTWWERNMSGDIPHDLKYLGKEYKDILKHCTRQGGSKALWGQ